MNCIKLKLFLAVTALLTFLYPSGAQVRFQKTFGGIGSEKAKQVLVIPGDGYAIVGYTGGSFGANGIYFLRIDQGGDTLFTRVTEISDSDDGRIVRNSDGSYVIAGTTSSFGQGGSEFYLLKTDSNANVLWVRSYGGIGNDISGSVEQTNDNGYIVSGYTQSFGAGLADLYLIKTDQNGDILWTRVVGGTNLESSTYAVNTPDGNYIAAGITTGFGAGGTDVYVIKVDNYGDTLWTRSFGGASEDVCRMVRTTTDNGVIVLGGSASFGDGSVYLIRLNLNGDTLWTKHYGADCGESPWSISETKDRGFIIAGGTCSFGATISDAYMLRIDSAGGIMWSRTYRWATNFENVFYDVKQTADGGFIAVGKTGDLTSSSFDIYVVKTDANGNSGCGDSLVVSVVGNTSTIVSSTSSSISTGGIMGSVSVNVSSTNTVGSVLCFDSITGINSRLTRLEENSSLQIYPNPFSDYATIEAYLPDEGSSGQLRVIDVLGVTHRVVEVGNGYNDITLLKGDLPGSGIYFCVLTVNDQVVEKIKFISFK